MTKFDILQAEHPILRQKAESVPADWFGSKQLDRLLAQMSLALADQPDGVALAAPQIGSSRRIFIVSHKVLPASPAGGPAGQTNDLAFINPQIIKPAKQTDWLEEGCLSVRHYYGQVKRSVKVKIAAQDRLGQKFEFTGSKLLAQIFQHEIDHLDGILFIDKARQVQYVKP